MDVVALVVALICVAGACRFFYSRGLDRGFERGMRFARIANTMTWAKSEEIVRKWREENR